MKELVQNRPNSLLFYVNGNEIIESNAEPDWTLLWYLRNKLNLTGSKLGCGAGGCGACTVLISCCTDRCSRKIEHYTVNACLAPLCSVDGCHVITVEGLGSVKKSNFHPVQSRLAEMFGTQCGFCTPGIVMSLYKTVAMDDNNELPTMQDIEEAFDGHLCRCTGYRSILDTAKTFARDVDKHISIQESSTSKITSTTFDKCISYLGKNVSSPPFQIEFPQKLQEYVPQSIHIKGSMLEWYRPISLEELLSLRHSYPGSASKLVFGNTAVQIERKFKHIQHHRLISITHVVELQQLKRTPNSYIIGAGITFTHLQSKLYEWKKEVNNDGGICEALIDQLKHFASTQIRNIASFGGSIVNASPISDLNPILQAANASLEFRRISVDNAERQVLLRDFFLPNRCTSMADDEVLIAVHIPIPSSWDKSFLRSYKQARRRDDSSAIVSAGLHVKLEQVKNDDNNDEWRIVSACFSFGGMASRITMAQQTQKELIGQVWKKITINKACESMLAELPLNEFTPGGQCEYRRTLLQSFLFKFYLYVCSQLRQTLVEQKHMSAAHIYRRPVSHGQQTIPERPLNQRTVGSSLSHRSAYLQTTGEAKYTNDLPSLPNTLHAALVLSTQPNARIKNIDIEAAQRLPGFVSFISYTDVPGSNMTGIVVHDEEVFASCIVPCIGTIIGLVVCDAEQTAYTAANLIQIDYELLAPVIVTIDDAIQYESYLGDEQCVRKGDPNKALSEAEHTLEETLLIGGQEHFYLETNCCMAIPSNDDEDLTLYSATQDPNKIQELVALAIGRDANRIKCLVKRIGGGFGGKDSRSVLPSIAVAVAAVKLGRPVRLNMERDVDMSVTGQRHPFKISYKVGFTSEGLFSALDVRLWSNAGCSFDQSMPILKKAMVHIDNTYQFHNVEIRGRLCKTHLPSNTAFRGFGCPQAIFACETIIEHVAAYLKLDPLIVRRLNLYQEGDLTYFGQALEHWHVPRILDELIQSSDFIRRQQTVDEFNRLNTYRKRGLSVLPTKFGISFMAKYLNQAGALVHVYKDGSVLVTHGGVEMGQGLHTKMVSIAAEVLGCNVERIHINETSTDKVANASATGASVSSDLYGKAVQHACEQIRERLNTLLIKADNNFQWEHLIKKAYYERIDLSAHGFYIIPEPLGEDFDNNRAHFSYFTQGAAVSEVELDTLTGDWHLLRADILMDVGTSLNPQIDIGQIEGGFMQGIGLFTMEEIIWGDGKQYKWVKPGTLATRGPDTYKIPSFSDVALDMRIAFLSDASNCRAIYSSKGIGEPPLALAASVLFALKQACMSYRQEQNFAEDFILHSPATVERLRMACIDEFTERSSFLRVG